MVQLKLKVYGEHSNPRFSRVAITAKYSEIEIVTVSGFTLFKDNQTPEYLAKFPLGQAPGLELSDGRTLTESPAIALFVAEQKPNNSLLGKDAWERAQILKYQSIGESQLILTLLNILYPYWKAKPYHTDIEAQSYKRLESVLSELEFTLSKQKYLVGDRLTLADIEIVSDLVFAYKYVLYPELRIKFPNLLNYFNRLITEPHFKNHFESYFTDGYAKEKLIVSA